MCSLSINSRWGSNDVLTVVEVRECMKNICNKRKYMNKMSFIDWKLKEKVHRFLFSGIYFSLRSLELYTPFTKFTSWLRMKHSSSLYLPELTYHTLQTHLHTSRSLTKTNESTYKLRQKALKNMHKQTKHYG